MSHYSELYTKSIQQPELFWSEQASELAWFKQPTKILNQKENGLYEWFPDGELNMSYLCIDHHIAMGKGEQTAIIYDSPATGKIKKYTFNELKHEVEQLAGAILSKGIQKGDTAIIYMPMIPEAVFSMLACARIGVIHSVVFGGFAPHELAIRIDDALPKLILSANYGIEFDKQIPYKPLLDEAIALANYKVPHTIIYAREGQKVDMTEGRDHDYSELIRQSSPATYVPVASTHPLYVLYTSGTTGKPKGIMRDTGGYATALKYSMNHVYDCPPGEVFWAASDVGWVVGHSYIVYGPLIQGCTTVLFEGKPIKTPDAGTFWRVAAEHKVRSMFTAPTAIRAIKKEDPEGLLIQKYDLSNLHYLFLAGERCDPATFEWSKEKLNKRVIDHWWQTESGWPMIGIQCGDEGNKEAVAGSSNFPICGFQIDILDEQGVKQVHNEEGYVCIKTPLPPGCLSSLWKDDEGFKNTYLSRFDGYYLSGDGGYYDEKGYYYIMGRIDDVINVAGHRLSTGEMEEIIASHPAIAECAVVGIADELRGQRPVGLVVLKDGQSLNETEIENETIALVRQQIGAVAFYRNTLLVKRLPKTRSGKILRKNIRMIADGVAFTTPSTIDDPQILTEINERFADRKIGKKFE